MEKRSAVVSGAGTGLGFATAKMLRQKGWTVFATVIEGQSITELKDLGITPMVVDITDPSQTDNFRNTVSAALGEEGLSALINVAGVAAVGSGVLEGISPENVELTFRVNVFGTFNMIRSFLPLLRKYGPARIVNIAAGVRTPAVFSGAYMVSKFAVEGITNVLRYEMAPFGIQVTSIEPAGMKTPMTANAAERHEKTWDRMPAAVREAYYDKLSPSLDFMSSIVGNADEPETVAELILEVLDTEVMKMRYMAKSVDWQTDLFREMGEDAFEAMMITNMKLK